MAAAPDPGALTGDVRGVAFAMTLAAAGGCLVGGSLVFLPIVQRINKPLLAAALALSAGVMLQVGLGEIMSASVGHFEADGAQPWVAQICTYLTFFFGVAMVRLLDVLLHAFEGSMSVAHCCARLRAGVGDGGGHGHAHGAAATQPLQLLEPTHESQPTLNPLAPPPGASPREARVARLGAARGAADKLGDEAETVELAAAAEGTAAGAVLVPAIDAKLSGMSNLAAIAIVAHSIPEGLTTCLAAASGTQAGIAIAV